MSKTIFQKNLKFTYEDFKNQDVANLMKNIWSYSSVQGKGCKICTTYRNWCIKALKKMARVVCRCRLCGRETIQTRRKMVQYKQIFLQTTACFCIVLYLRNCSSCIAYVFLAAFGKKHLAHGLN